MGGKKTFLLGLGAQKAATTWLAKSLVKTKGVDMGFAAKYHVWDVVDLEGIPPVQRDGARRSDHLRRALMRRYHPYYFYYFERQLKSEDVHLTGDLSPSYAGLSAERMSYIVEAFRKRKIAAKAIFIIRDPVDRCISAAAMAQRKVPKFSKMDLEEVVRDRYRSERYDFKTQYGETIKRAETAFDPGKSQVFLFETLFTPKGMNALSEFLNVDIDKTKAAQVQNAGSEKQPVSEATRAEIARHYRGVYEYCAARFPVAMTRWSGFQYL